MCDRNGGRRLRQWLIEQIDSELYPGLIWENEEKTMFRIPWKHAGKQDYNQEVDASIFKVGTDSSYLFSTTPGAVLPLLTVALVGDVHVLDGFCIPDPCRRCFTLQLVSSEGICSFWYHLACLKPGLT